MLMVGPVNSNLCLFRLSVETERFSTPVVGCSGIREISRFNLRYSCGSAMRAICHFLPDAARFTGVFFFAFFYVACAYDDIETGAVLSNSHSCGVRSQTVGTGEVRQLLPKRRYRPRPISVVYRSSSKRRKQWLNRKI